MLFRLIHVAVLKSNLFLSPPLEHSIIGKFHNYLSRGTTGLLSPLCYHKQYSDKDLHVSSYTWIYIRVSPRYVMGYFLSFRISRLSSNTTTPVTLPSQALGSSCLIYVNNWVFYHSKNSCVPLRGRQPEACGYWAHWVKHGVFFLFLFFIFSFGWEGTPLQHSWASLVLVSGLL